MLTIYDVKNYLRCDDDDVAITALMHAADSYMDGAVDNFHERYEKADASWQAKADLCKKLLIADWYENRTPYERPIAGAVQLLIVQLQLEGAEHEADTD